MIGTFVEVCFPMTDQWFMGRIVSAASDDQIIVQMRSSPDVVLPERMVVSLFGQDKTWRVLPDQRPSANR